MTIVLRPKLLWRTPGPLLVAAGAAFAAAGMLWGLVLVAIGLPFLPTVWIRVVIGEMTIRRRGRNGRRTTIPLDSIDTLQLRRLPFSTTRWLGRGFRIGPLWTVPLTLRLQTDGATRLQLRCVWWRNWRSLARFVAAHPPVQMDARTRSRIDGYVGPIPVITSIQP